MDDLYKRLIDFVPLGMSVIDPIGRIKYINSTFFKSLNESVDYLMRADLTSDSYNEKLSESIYYQVMREKKAVRASQIYVNEQKNAFKLSLYEEPYVEGGKIQHIFVRVESILPMGLVEDMKHLHDLFKPRTLIYKSEVMHELVKRINCIAPLPVNILLTGESGVGKDVLAEYIYSLSGGKKVPFVTVNCAALSENLIESELFGYERGAFTGAEKGGKKGLIEQAVNGTLFLDEINSLPLNLQGKLLRAIETKLIRRVGGSTEIPVNFRLICASNRKLESMVRDRTFREDLYYRINTFEVNIPPLRERRDDIVPLLDYFLSEYNEKYNMHRTFSWQDVQSAFSYDWPGNVRELRNFVEQYVVVGYSPILRKNSEVPQLMEENSFAAIDVSRIKATADTSLKSQLAYYEKEIIRTSLNNNTSKKNAAKELQIDPAVLSRKIAKYNL